MRKKLLDRLHLDGISHDQIPATAALLAIAIVCAFVLVITLWPVVWPTTHIQATAASAVTTPASQPAEPGFGHPAILISAMFIFFLLLISWQTVRKHWKKFDLLHSFIQFSHRSSRR